MTERLQPLKVVSALLTYPSPELHEAVRELDADNLEGRTLRGLDGFVRWYASTPVSELQRSYTETFDFSKRNALHLTYHLHGDRRRRGLALLRLKQA
jgi:nitrate reductase delta subunit